MQSAKRIGYIIVGVVLVFIFVYSTVALLVSQAAYNSDKQKTFLTGKVPDTLPDGLYMGVGEYPGGWVGKKFDAANKSGINVFKEGDATVEKYVFSTYVAKGVQDAEKDVLKIDYNLPENPFYLRVLQDEIVEVSPGHYLGKLQLRLIPFIPFVIGFFELQK